MVRFVRNGEVQEMRSPESLTMRRRGTYEVRKFGGTVSTLLDVNEGFQDGGRFDEKPQETCKVIHMI